MRSFLQFLFLFSFSLTFNAQTDHWETVVYENNTWNYIVPTAEPDTNWRKPTFTATGWLSGQGGFGFGDSDDNTTISQSKSVYIRIVFNISDTSKISKAILNADYDDGFVAYLNNTEIARANMSTTVHPPFGTLASANHEAVMYSGGNPDYFNISQSALHNVIRNGTNVLAIQIHNVTTTSSDLSSRFWLSLGIKNTSVYYGPTPSWFSGPVDFTSSNLPIVVINTGNQAIVNEPKITADMGIIYNGTGVRNYITDAFNNYNGKIGIEIRGNYSASLPQKPYGFETRDTAGANLNVSLLGMPPENDWALLATYNDKSFVRNSLSNRLFQLMGHYATRSQFVEVVIDGEYKGIYMLSEVIKRDNDRVDIAKLNTVDVTWPEISGGYIIKTDYWNANNSWQTSYSPIDHPGMQIHLAYDYPSEVDIVQLQKNYIQGFIYDMETTLYGPNYAHPTNGYRKYMSVISFMDYFFVNELARNVDGYKKSCFYHKEKDDTTGTIGKLKAGPVWDFDWAWKDIWDCSIFQATDGSGWSHHINDCNTDNYSPGWMIRLLQDSTFTSQLNCRWQNFRNTILDTTQLFNYIDSTSNYLIESQQRHFAYWGNLGQATGTPEIQAPRQTYAAEINELNAWIRRRLIWLDLNMFGNSNGCLVTGINNQTENNNLNSVYPNPFESEINLSIYLDTPQNITVTLYNSVGQEMMVPVTKTGKLHENTLKLELPDNLSSGLYMIKINTSNRSWTRSIVRP